MTTNDTRTPRERAEEAVTERYKEFKPGETFSPADFIAGFLARDAETTTVTTEQIEKAAKDLAWDLNEWEDGQIVWDPSEVAEEIEDCKPLAELVLRAAGFRIEGSDE